MRLIAGFSGLALITCLAAGQASAAESVMPVPLPESVRQEIYSTSNELAAKRKEYELFLQVRELELKIAKQVADATAKYCPKGKLDEQLRCAVPATVEPSPAAQQ